MTRTPARPDVSFHRVVVRFSGRKDGLTPQGLVRARSPSVGTGRPLGGVRIADLLEGTS